ncbi:MAG TPA: hypothetical protein VGS41_01240 [Chthonomonadales bacterium]|nr:hypothetical protein [Chthonomonadales bacterium]
MILDYDFRRKDGAVQTVYCIYPFVTKQRVWVRETDLQCVGRMPTALHYGQHVMVSSEATGRQKDVRGSVTGITWTPEANTWGYTVRLPGGTSIGVDANEVRPPRLRADYGERAFKSLAVQSKRQLASSLRKRPWVLPAGSRAPRTGRYRQIGRT